MKIVFRADASNEIGTGHVMRCLTVADAARARGGECSFVCRAHRGNLIESIQARGYLVSALAAPTGGMNDIGGALRHASWLGASQKEDAAQTLQAIQGVTPDWLVVDHYAIDSHWERELRQTSKQLMVIDDLADRQHECDVLLDQNWFGETTAIRYDDLTPADCIRLLGPRHALIKPEYVALRAEPRSRDGHIGRVLVFLGGSDPDNGTALVLSVLTQMEFRELALDVVIGPNHPDPAGIAETVRERPATRLHTGLPSLAPLMAEADLMIGGGGSTTWERMCLGLPAIVISIADNQTPTNLALAAAGCIVYAGEIGGLTADDLCGALRYCLSNPDALRKQSALIRELSPGNGTAGIVDLLFR